MSLMDIEEPYCVFIVEPIVAFKELSSVDGIWGETD